MTGDRRKRASLPLRMEVDILPHISKLSSYLIYDDVDVARIRSRGMTVVRYTGDVARYRSMGHAKADKNPSR